MEEKKIAGRYYTETGNTKKLVEAIGKSVGVQAESIEVVHNYVFTTIKLDKI
ncbi:hypothetical protein [Alkalibaculum sporogenes]|uniref:hypothetical protein n=1 Tax=Alkalibaculum sporogenes TaxID=2655001 RepID=UPI00187B9536|nr:hypothetical protein [Alkalibaculum sporogenes]